MVQILPQIEKRPSIGQRLSQAVGNGLNIGSQMFKEHQQKEAISQLLGSQFSNLPPEFQKMAFESKLEQQNKAAQLAQQMKLQGADYETMRNTFGQQFADIWKASPTGAKTKLEDAAFDALRRGENIKDVLESIQAPIAEEKLPEEIPQMKNGNISKDFNWPDYTKPPKGYTLKDWRDERKTWRQENAPIFAKNKEKLIAASRDKLGIKKLDKLNESRKVGEGFEGSLINPETSEFYGVAQLAGLVSPEAQEWVKEIARFQNRAKDAFGSRVTNFDLQSYMKQFPGLLNSYEGRKRILKMMDINNKLDELYEKSVNKVYQKYGLNGIPQEQAEHLATEFIKDETEKLRNEYVNLDEKNQSQFGREENKLSGRIIDVRGPDGQLYEIDESEVGELPQGWRII